MAYTGGFSGISWNAQAILSLDPERRERKRRVLGRLLARRPDFVLLQELHSTPAAAAIWQVPAGYRIFFSHGSASSAGVGVLVRDVFLRNFNDTSHDNPEHLLEDIVPGRVARLPLSGPREICTSLLPI